MSQEKNQSQIDRKLCQRSLYYLCKEVLGYKDMVPHVHGDFCDFATNARYGRFRQATMPRSFFKTWVWTVGKSIWLTLPDEDGLFTTIFPYKGANVRVLIASNVIDNASKIIFKIKQEWMHNDRLREAFPELVPDFNKTRWSDHVAEVKRTIRATEGTYTAVGAGGSVISQHFDHIIEDDLVYAKKDDFTGMELMPSQEDIDNAIGWHKLTFSLFANPQTGCLDNVGTRWAPRDLIYYIRNFEKHYTCFEMAAENPQTGYPTWPERYPREELERIQASQGNRIYECFPKEAPILMSDWSCVPIESINLGDEVVGFTNGTGIGKGKLVRATVNLVERHVKDVVKITLSSGNVIRCTADHPWYTGRRDKSHQPYLPAKVGRPLLQVYDCLRTLTTEELLDYRYLAGIIDGEGACSHGSIAIGQSEDANPDVYESIEAVICRLGIPYSIATVNPNETHILRNKEIARGLASAFVLNGGRQVKGDIIRFGKPAKAKRILNTIWKRPHGVVHKKDVVVSIEPDGREVVYAIGTTAGNYVAYGYATKNTQYLNRPRAMEDIVFKKEYVHQHHSLDDFPIGLTYRTIVDLAGWGDSKGTARAVVLTGAMDEKHHLWIARLDVGRFNPSEVIELYFQHAKQFSSRVLIEEIQYQRAIRHFAHERMERTGEQVMQEQLPYDGRKDAKNLRIRNLETPITNGFLHILTSMQPLLEELEFYPYSKTVDILDCLGYLMKVARPAVCAPVQGRADPFSMGEIERELKRRGNHGYPFEQQLAGRLYGLN